ncbi:putative methylesterase 13, chloroplastic isoform X2 [Selaginella moellendorffii]|uniref:putative methylesterase 13, chloroplastic isoform X2 n=1 Tax=Selaginella moellendorffii TaxID=88036 RepID=UPI000D1CB133|nr:putative methylesterase 13, chloroplastic isoform X2 [Selaginella moellendorffii]|eukprot:XP_024529639.1 putative methylesterase 13, chloroplastic isoform X2 [Selaginella moellendorffii]
MLLVFQNLQTMLLIKIVVTGFLSSLLLLLRTEASDDDRQHHFVLVHGAGHGAWCWYKVTNLLHKAGHKVDAIDLLSAGISSFDPTRVGTLVRYTSPLVDFLEQLPHNSTVVLVGHSLGGASLTYALEKFPEKIVAAIYVAGLMLPSGPAGTALNNQLQGRLPVPGPAGTVPLAIPFQLDLVQNLLYNLSPPENVELAKSLLKPVPVLDPAVNFTQARYGSVPRYFIKTDHDNVVLPQDQDLLIRTTPPIGVFRISSDHTPFFSNPSGLASLLDRIARTLP